jgi:hypothetical protein
MNYHKECLRLLGEGKVNMYHAAHEFAAKHPKEFLQFIAPSMVPVKPKIINVKIHTEYGNAYPCSSTLKMSEDVFAKCKTTVLETHSSLQMLTAIKTIRSLTNCDLKDGKCFYDMIKRGEL